MRLWRNYWVIGVAFVCGCLFSTVGIGLVPSSALWTSPIVCGGGSHLAYQVFTTSNTRSAVFRCVNAAGESQHVATIEIQGLQLVLVSLVVYALAVAAGGAIGRLSGAADGRGRGSRRDRFGSPSDPHASSGGLGSGSRSNVDASSTGFASSSGQILLPDTPATTLASANPTADPTANPTVSPTAPATSVGMDGQIARLQKLDELHRSGALTAAEFELEKARVIAER